MATRMSGKTNLTPSTVVDDDEIILYDISGSVAGPTKLSYFKTWIRGLFTLGDAASRDTTDGPSGGANLMAKGFAGIGDIFDMTTTTIPGTSTLWQDGTYAEFKAAAIRGSYWGLASYSDFNGLGVRAGVLEVHIHRGTNDGAHYAIMQRFHTGTSSSGNSIDVYERVSAIGADWGPWQLISNSAPVYYTSSATPTLQPGTYEAEVAGSGANASTNGNNSSLSIGSTTVTVNGGTSAGNLGGGSVSGVTDSSVIIGGGGANYSTGGSGGKVYATFDVATSGTVNIVVGATVANAGNGWCKVTRIK